MIAFMVSFHNEKQYLVSGTHCQETTNTLPQILFLSVYAILWTLSRITIPKFSLMMFFLIMVWNDRNMKRSQMQGIVHEQNVQSQQPPASDNNSISDFAEKINRKKKDP